MTSPNIVRIVLDTAHSEDVGIGSGPETMPFLDGLAEHGTTFVATRTNASWTQPSHGTLFSGELTNDHLAQGGHHTFDSSETLAARLSESGYQMTAVSNNTWVSSESGFDTGFDKFITAWKLYQDGAEFGGVARTRLGEIRDIFEARGVWEDTFFVVTGDNGGNLVDVGTAQVDRDTDAIEERLEDLGYI